MIKLNAGQLIQQALDNNPNETEFSLGDGTYEGQITIARPNIHLFSSSTSLNSTSGNAILTAKSPYTLFVQPFAYNTSLDNLTLQTKNNQATILGIKGSNTRITSCLLYGDSVAGAHRGIEANGDTILIKDCKTDFIFLPDRDTQAICGWSGARNIVIDGCTLSAGSESVMFGGSDPTSENNIPCNISLLNSVLTKPATPNKWAKNALELKNCINFYAFNCTLQYAGIAGGQGGYAIVLTPRNQGGKAPYSQVKNVLIEHCVLKYTCGAVLFQGDDNDNPSQFLENVVIRDCDFNLDPLAQGRKRILEFLRGPINCTLQNITVAMQPDNQFMSSVSIDTKPPVNLTLRNIHFPKTKYGLHIDNNMGGPDGLRKFAPSTVIDSVAMW